MRRREKPPRWLEGFLSSILPAGDPRNVVLGDLQEEFAVRSAGGLLPAWVWYARVAVGVAFHYGSRRVAMLFRRRRLDSGGGMHGWARDLKYAIRRIRREQGFSTVLVLTIAVSIGANATIFGAVKPVVAPDL
ncbi:MAG: hypothetical protein KAJ42_14825, partial [Gemmatimonadetes bacterium]|nr:hypothetical protein [Gemmatimonadota bacterium]